MDIEGSSGQLFPNWEEAHAYYTTHYHRACMHILLPNFHNTKKKKTRIVKSAMPSTHRHHCHNSSCSLAGNYCLLYDEDDTVTPAIVEPALYPLPAVPTHGVKSAPDFYPTAMANVTCSPGTTGNPIEVFSNFPTPIAHQETPKCCKKAQRLGLGSAALISPTPASTSLPAILTQLSESCKQPPHISNGPKSFVYIISVIALTEKVDIRQPWFILSNTEQQLRQIMHLAPAFKLTRSSRFTPTQRAIPKFCLSPKHASASAQP